MTVTPGITISVIVPFRNDAQYLGELFASLSNQTVTEGWEVVAVNNGSSDASRAIVERFQDRLPLAIIDATARANPSYARNVGVAQSRGHKLLFIDADDAVHEGYVAAMATALDNQVLVTSRVDSITLNPAWVRDAHGPPWQAEGISTFYDFLPASGVNIGVRRELYESLGGFKEMFAPCEDIAFSWDAQRLHHASIHFVSAALYRYRYRHTLQRLFRQSARWGVGSVLLYRHFREAGMPQRTWSVACEEWRRVLSGLARAPGRPALAALIVRLGYCVGRLRGSLRYRVRYL